LSLQNEDAMKSRSLGSSDLPIAASARYLFAGDRPRAGKVPRFSDKMLPRKDSPVGLDSGQLSA
jgi:hypothetical protein